MKHLKEFFRSKDNKFAFKYRHYLEIYEKHFSRFRNLNVNVLEIGVNKGGSLQMWKQYFGPNSNIFGLDILKKSKMHEEDRIKIFIGDQEDRVFLKDLVKKLPTIDILIDDGGHTMSQQITTFEELFPYISKNGIYLCEDIQTSYRKRYGGGYLKKDTFIEYSKNFIDKIHAWDSRSIAVEDFTKSVFSLHYYNGVIVIEKRPMKRLGIITNKKVIK